MKTFTKYVCPFCDKRIKNAGFAKVSHLRTHVREGLCTEKNIRVPSGHGRTVPAIEFPATEKGQLLLREKGYKN